MNPRVQMERVINQSFHNHAGIIVLRDGEKLYENYYQGYTADNRVHIASATKSIVSILYGIAVEQGCLDIRQKVLDSFPDYPIPRGERTLPQITIEDMLTMRAPYRCKNEPYRKMFTGTGWVKMALDILGGNGKIGDFVYAPLLGIQILSGILTKATGQSILSFANEHLFEPLGIHVKEPLSYTNQEDYMNFLKSRDINGWIVDPEGIHTAGWGLTLTTMDMAKIGQLYLNRGRWQDKQIVSERWVDESTHEHSCCKQWKMSYGYLWWILDDQKHIYAAIGDGGNTIYVNAPQKLVIAISCTYMQGAKDRRQLIRNYIEPVFLKS